MVPFSCTVTGVVCIEGTDYPNEVPAQMKACANTPGGPGVFSMGPCTGVAGCCYKPAETDCLFPMPGETAATYESSCSKLGGTWMPADGGVGDGGGEAGASGAAAFVGTWARSGTQTVTCPMGNPTTNQITGNLVIALGSMSGSITATTPDGCATQYSVSGNVATATAGQTCNIVTDAGVAETITTNSRTFTLSADGLTLMAVGNETIDKTATMTMCSAMGSGTYTKM
jgi:hypothetical protein